MTENEFTVVPVTVDFDERRVIGEMRILTAELPKTPDFVFSLGYRAFSGNVGESSYDLLTVSLVQDTKYAGYLRQEQRSGIYEGHITIDPVQGERLKRALKLAWDNGFKTSEEPGYLNNSYSERTTRNDAFMTGHSPDFSRLQRSMKQLILDLQAEGYKVRRYKIEHIEVDSKRADEWSVL